jgi:hypothetical protein
MGSKERLAWLLSAVGYGDFGTICTIRYRYPIIQYVENRLDIWQTHKVIFQPLIGTSREAGQRK